MTLDVDRLRELLEADDDHMVATGDDLIWLMAQIVHWPRRIHPERTTNDRFLRFSAVATVASLLTRIAELEKGLEKLEGAVGDYRMKHDLKGDGSPEAGRAWDLMKRAQGEARTLLSGSCCYE